MAFREIKFERIDIQFVVCDGIVFNLLTKRECEEAIKDENGATTRCIPFVQAKHSDVCVHCGKPAKCEVYFGKAY